MFFTRYAARSTCSSSVLTRSLTRTSRASNTCCASCRSQPSCRARSLKQAAELSVAFPVEDGCPAMAACLRKRERRTMKPITDVHALFRYQRAIRNFTAEEVPDALVDRVLTAAIHAPSGSNTQPWHFIVIRDQAVKQAISDVYEEARADASRDRPRDAGGVRQPLSAAPGLIVARG